MNEITGYIPQQDRKKVLLISDDIRHFSGVATMSREIVLNTAHRLNWVQIAGAMKHPENMKRLDISQDTNTRLNIDDASVFLYPTDGYGNPDMVRAIIDIEKPDAIIIFTDPRYFTWLFRMEHEIRTKIPIVYYNIWDNYPAPLYNKPFYESCDALFAISKQTENINKIVLDDVAKDRLIKYVPHGIDEKVFHPINEFMTEEMTKMQEMRQKLFGKQQPKFVFFYNARNIRRKSVPDLIAAYKVFTDKIGKTKAKDCVLLMHTHIVDENGTNLQAVADLLLDPSYQRIVFTQDIYTPEGMNILYNIADATCLISSNEGWGLSITESMMAGKMFIANVTGGMQDQMRFEDSDGNWIVFDDKFCSNHFGTVTEHGPWTVPVFPSNMSLVGSPPTPYIFDDRCDFRDVADAMVKVYEMNHEDRVAAGLAGRNWATSNEANMTASAMGNNIADGIYELLANWKPKPSFELIKAETLERKALKHSFTY